METFKVTRLYEDENGDSFFEDLFYPLKDNGPIGFISENFAVKDLFFRKVVPEYDNPFHTAPQKQFIIILDGEIEIETSLKEKRRFSGADVLLVEDITGKGHATRNLKPVTRQSIFVTIA